MNAAPLHLHTNRRHPRVEVDGDALRTLVLEVKIAQLQLAHRNDEVANHCIAALDKAVEGLRVKDANEIWRG